MKLLLCLLAVASATELTAANYEETVVNSKEVWMVEFSSKMCKSREIAIAMIFSRNAM